MIPTPDRYSFTAIPVRQEPRRASVHHEFVPSAFYRSSLLQINRSYRSRQGTQSTRRRSMLLARMRRE